MRGPVAVVARRAVRAGEELTLDYALISADVRWSMECRCGSLLCRGAVRGDDWRRPELAARYRGHFAPVVERLVAEGG